eukprot:TRINITY_DN18332_c0_g1_i1.p1 TRINITY_DN18332_c0_g1~~TRINITY_DN18332_c0_g1_i1.p1  ORF type:complete len:849 (-),score=172.18 TRINITY_DN18332_c0_g1_i1:76-2622(-)
MINEPPSTCSYQPTQDSSSTSFFQIHWPSFSPVVMKGQDLTPVVMFPHLDPRTAPPTFMMKINLVDEFLQELNIPMGLMPDIFLITPDHLPTQLSFKIKISPAELTEFKIGIGNTNFSSNVESHICHFRFTLCEANFSRVYGRTDSQAFSLVNKSSKITEVDWRVLVTEVIPAFSIPDNPTAFTLDVKGWFPLLNFEAVFSQRDKQIKFPARWLCHERLEIIIKPKSFMGFLPGPAQFHLLTSKGTKFESLRGFTFIDKNMYANILYSNLMLSNGNYNNPRNFDEVVEQFVLKSYNPNVDDLSGILQTMLRHTDPSCGFSLLTWAVYSQQSLTFISLLCRSGFNINHPDNNGRTPLHWSVALDDDPITAFLVENGADVNKANNQGNTCLHFSASSGNLRMSTFLLSRGAQVNSENQEGETPVHIAAAGGHVELVRLYVETHTARLDIKTRSTASTALHYAAEEGHTDLFNLLVHLGSDPYLTTSLGLSAADLFTEWQQASFLRKSLTPGDDRWRAVARGDPWKRNEFQKLDPLGTGTFAQVVLVLHVPTGNYFAMKICKKALIIQLRQVEHIRNEKAILSEITHPFIVKLFGTFQDDQNLYMIFDFVSGGEIFSYLRRAKVFNNATANFYAAEITVALEFLHGRGVIYRDLKPENVLLAGDGHIKLADFGFAKRLLGDTTWTLCGTPEYLAPEVVSGKGHGKEADWWSLGIFIFEMLSGYPPFFDDNIYVVYQKILAGQVQYPSALSSAAKDLIMKLLLRREQRLGREGSQHIKEHPWFEGVSWEKAAQKMLTPPMMPWQSHAGDPCNYRENDEQNEDLTEPEPTISGLEISPSSLMSPHVGDPFRNF